MRIIYDPTAFGQQRYGGVSRYFNEIIPRLAKMSDLQISVLMGLYINRYGLEKHRRAFEHFGGFRRPYIRGTHQWANAFSARWFRRFSRGVEFDVYHTTGFFECDPRPGVRKRIITVHDMILDRAPDFEGVRAWRDITHKRIRAADGIVCVSQHTRRDVIDLLGVDPAKIAVIYHGSPARVDPSAGRVESAPYILFVGVRPEYKNFDLLLKAYAKLPEVRRTHKLVLFGGRPLRPSEIEMIASLGVSDRVRWLGEGDDSQLANLYTHASAFVYPSLYEGFGMPLLEAFAYGCPALASNSTSIPEVGGDAAIYFDPHNVDDLAGKLAQLLSDAQLRATMIGAGTQRLGQFSWDRSAEEHAAFYRRIAG